VGEADGSSRKAVYLALAVLPDGTRDILGSLDLPDQMKGPSLGQLR
jgi:hypothetical protein